MVDKQKMPGTVMIDLLTLKHLTLKKNLVKVNFQIRPKK